MGLGHVNFKLNFPATYTLGIHSIHTHTHTACGSSLLIFTILQLLLALGMGISIKNNGDLHQL